MLSVLVTGANGFIGKNLCIRLKEKQQYVIKTFNRADSEDRLYDLILNSDVIVHLAGENRPKDESLFNAINFGLTNKICNFLKENSLTTPIIFSSSVQAECDNAYGRSKLLAEEALTALSNENGNFVKIMRLPGVFGKWSKPNYNSVVSTFCHNIANGLKIQIDDPNHELSLIYIDDVINQILDIIERDNNHDSRFIEISNINKLTVGELAEKITSFSNVRNSLITEPVGEGILRALYATYVSYLKPKDFSYCVESHKDERGIFVEMLKTINSGQFSFFTAHPGVTRGGHYHHSKTEKFLVISGKAKFGFRNIISDEKYFLETSGESPEIVETVPGWTHDIKNIGSEDLIVMLWANEIFDQNNPDTYNESV